MLWLSDLTTSGGKISYCSLKVGLRSSFGDIISPPGMVISVLSTRFHGIMSTEQEFYICLHIQHWVSEYLNHRMVTMFWEYVSHQFSRLVITNLWTMLNISMSDTLCHKELQGLKIFAGPVQDYCCQFPFLNWFQWLNPPWPDFSNLYRDTIDSWVLWSGITIGTFAYSNRKPLFSHRTRDLLDWRKTIQHEKRLRKSTFC